MNLTSYQNKDLNPTATSSDFIWIKEKSLSKSFCEKLINKFEKSPDEQYDGRIGTGQINENIKQTKDLTISDKDGWKKEDKVLFKALRDGISEYYMMCDKIDTSLMPSSSFFKFHDTGYQLQRYEPGGFYEWHNDWTMVDGGSRVYTYIWYLNTLKKKQEGYTQFIDGTKVQPKVGRLVIFPATWTYLHRAFPPKVRKYICTGWIYGKPL